MASTTGAPTIPIWQEATMLSQVSGLPIAGNIIAPATLAYANMASGYLDLRNCVEAFVYVGVGKADTTQPGTAPVVRVRRTRNANAAGTVGGGAMPGGINPTCTITGTIVKPAITVDAAAGATSLTVTNTSMAVGQRVCIIDTGYTFARFEVHTISQLVSTTGIVLDDGLLFAHTAVQGDLVINLAEMWECYCPGGSVWQVQVDYRASATGSNQLVWAYAVTHLGNGVSATWQL